MNAQGEDGSAIPTEWIAQQPESLEPQITGFWPPVDVSSLSNPSDQKEESYRPNSETITIGLND